MQPMNETTAPDRGALVYCGEIIRDRGEMLSLTDMWKAAGSPENREPFNWARKEGATFIEAVALSHNLPASQVMRATRGKGGGTLAHWQVGLAYAKYLSPEFHMWANTAVREKMEGRRADLLPAETAEMFRSMHGMLKMLSRKVTVLEHAPPPVISAEAIEQAAEAAVARRMYAARRGKTAGQIYREAGFPPLKGISSWLGNLWVRLGFQIEGNGHGELGDRTARLFDPDKVSAWLKTGGRTTVEQKLAERRGQRVFRLVPPGPVPKPGLSAST